MRSTLSARATIWRLGTCARRPPTMMQSRLSYSLRPRRGWPKSSAEAEFRRRSRAGMNAAQRTRGSFMAQIDVDVALEPT